MTTALRVCSTSAAVSQELALGLLQQVGCIRIPYGVSCTTGHYLPHYCSAQPANLRARALVPP